MLESINAHQNGYYISIQLTSAFVCSNASSHGDLPFARQEEQVGNLLRRCGGYNMSLTSLNTKT